MSTSNMNVLLQASDSQIVNTGFVEFVKNYKDADDVEQNSAEPKADVDVRQSAKISSPAALSVQSSSLKSIATPAISGAEIVVDDAGFNRFLDEWTSRVEKEAKVHWKQMSKRDRAFYAPKDNASHRASSDSAVSSSVSGTIRRAREKVCSNLVQRKPKKGLKPKSVRKSCPKPKSVKFSKPRAAKKRVSKKCPIPKAVKRVPTPKPSVL